MQHITTVAVILAYAIPAICFAIYGLHLFKLCFAKLVKAK